MNIFRDAYKHNMLKCIKFANTNYNGGKRADKFVEYIIEFIATHIISICLIILLLYLGIGFYVYHIMWASIMRYQNQWSGIQPFRPFEYIDDEEIPCLGWMMSSAISNS